MNWWHASSSSMGNHQGFFNERLWEHLYNNRARWYTQTSLTIIRWGSKNFITFCDWYRGDRLTIVLLSCRINDGPVYTYNTTGWSLWCNLFNGNASLIKMISVVDDTWLYSVGCLINHNCRWWFIMRWIWLKSWRLMTRVWYLIYAGYEWENMLRIPLICKTM